MIHAVLILSIMQLQHSEHRNQTEQNSSSTQDKIKDDEFALSLFLLWNFFSELMEQINMLCAKKKRNDCKLSLGSNHCFSNKPDLSIKHEIIKYFSAPSQKTSECCRGSRRGRAATSGGCGQRVKGGEKYSSSGRGRGWACYDLVSYLLDTIIQPTSSHNSDIFKPSNIFIWFVRIRPGMWGHTFQEISLYNN